jgi:hypothetical protein
VPVKETQRVRAARFTVAMLAQLGSRLTDRDRQIACACYEHRVLTTQQLQRLFFSGGRTTRERLHELYELRVLEHFRPPRRHGEGSAAYHWILDTAGAHIVAEELGVEITDLRWRRQASIAVAHSTKLNHQLTVNEFFTRLAEEAQAQHGSLSQWWGERRATAMLDGIVQPDGYARVELRDGLLELLLELDRGTEPHARLVDKARRYAKALHRTAAADHMHVIIAVPSAARAQRARETLDAIDAPVTTFVWTPDSPSTLAALLRQLEASLTCRRAQH